MIRRPSRGLPAFAALLLVAAASNSAHAYCRTNACDPSRGDDCKADEPCLGDGVKVAWRSSCLTFAVQRDGSPKNGIDARQFEAAIQTAFGTWMNADCGGGTHPSFSIASLGEVECNQVEFNKDQGNANIYMFVDDEWGPRSAIALALTTVSYNYKTGEIYDTDVEVNGTDGQITNSAPEDGADLLSIITHESGHFLGLAHSAGGTVMAREYNPKIDNLRNLTQDDIDGICAIYPPDRQAATDDCNPRRGFQSSCHTDDDSGCTCGVILGRPSAPSAWLALGAALLGVLARRRRR